jgi:hypothetical protein
VRFLNTIVPARYLEYFRELALVARDGKLAAPDDMRRVMSRYGCNRASDRSIRADACDHRQLCMISGSPPP